MVVVIKPTVGRILWYRPQQDLDIPNSPDNQPCAAIVTYVHSPVMVNLAVFDHNGNHFKRTSVYLVQPESPAPSHSYCEWPLYATAHGAVGSVTAGAIPAVGAGRLGDARIASMPLSQTGAFAPAPPAPPGYAGLEPAQETHFGDQATAQVMRGGTTFEPEDPA